ncbi:MAG: UPF0149 family protein [Wenzhouxiangellaceae bacterium]|nr:UPF0149 family protein [Wenzhouxiangellaceae bacterium]
MHDSESRLAWALALAADSDPVRIAETHGLVTGLVCGAPDEADARLVEELLRLNPPPQAKPDLDVQLLDAVAGLKRELASSELDFQLLLPTDERSLDERTACLAHWTGGFLAGFGARGELPPRGEAREAVGLLEQITRAGCDPEAGDEQQESALTELSEFVRVAALLLREHRLETPEA